MVCAVSDEAEWIRGFVDLHRPDAVRILDFPHALGYVAQAGQAVYGEETVAFTQWFTTQRQVLKQGAPEEVLRGLRRLATTAKRHGAAQAPYRPPPEHPWRRFRFGRASSHRPRVAPSAKL